MTLSRSVVDALLAIVGPRGLVTSHEGRLVYECDMHTFYKGMPDVVALPDTTEQVQAIVRLCRAERVPIVPRGSGAGVIGGGMAGAGQCGSEPDERGARGGLREPVRCGAARADQPVAESGRPRARLVLRAG